MRIRKMQGAVSTEMVIVVVLIAVFSILGYMFLGQQLRNHLAGSVDKIGGQTASNTRNAINDTNEMRQSRDSMGGGSIGTSRFDSGTGNNIITGFDVPGNNIQEIP